jgi:hypothetical protein
VRRASTSDFSRNSEYGFLEEVVDSLSCVLKMRGERERRIGV